MGRKKSLAPKRRNSAEVARRTTGGVKRMKRSSKVQEELIEREYLLQIENWKKWTPQEARSMLLKEQTGASADYVSGLLGFIVQCKRMIPKLTFGELRRKVADGAGHLF